MYEYAHLKIHKQRANEDRATADRFRLGRAARLERCQAAPWLELRLLLRNLWSSRYLRPAH